MHVKQRSKLIAIIVQLIRLSEISILKITRNAWQILGYSPFGTTLSPPSK